MWHRLIRSVFATFQRCHPSPSSSPFPNHLRHLNTKLSVTGTCSRRQPGVRFSATPRDPEIGDAVSPQVEGAKQLAPTEEDLSHVSWDSNHSSLMVILNRAQRETKRWRQVHKFRFSPLIFPSGMAVNSCGYLGSAYPPTVG